MKKKEQMGFFRKKKPKIQSYGPKTREEHQQDTISRAWKSIIIASIITFVGIIVVVITAFCAPVNTAASNHTGAPNSLGSVVGFSIGTFLIGFGISLFAWFYTIRSDAKDAIKWCKQAHKNGVPCDKGDPFNPGYPAGPHFGPPPYVPHGYGGLPHVPHGLFVPPTL